VLFALNEPVTTYEAKTEIAKNERPKKTTDKLTDTPLFNLGELNISRDSTTLP
jgi:hypothetical protein